jgi:beta-galactosidase
LSLDRESIAADRRDVAHIVVQILDSAGRTVPTAANAVTFQLEGEGKLIGVDNGDPQSHDDYKATRVKAFNGLCLAIVQSTAKPGQIVMTATSQELKPSRVVITTRI